MLQESLFQCVFELYSFVKIQRHTYTLDGFKHTYIHTYIHTYTDTRLRVSNIHTYTLRSLRHTYIQTYMAGAQAYIHTHLEHARLPEVPPLTIQKKID